MSVARYWLGSDSTDILLSCSSLFVLEEDGRGLIRALMGTFNTPNQQRAKEPAWGVLPGFIGAK